MSKLLILVVAMALAPAFQAQPGTDAKGDVVKLVKSAEGDPLPDSRVIAVAGDRLKIDKSAVLLNGESVRDLSPQVAEQLGTWDQTVPAGHYFVIGERQEGGSTSRYNGLIPAAKIAGKVSK